MVADGSGEQRGDGIAYLPVLLQASERVGPDELVREGLKTGALASDPTAAAGQILASALRGLPHVVAGGFSPTNMKFALLEFWSMRTDDDHVLERESYWKDVLHARSLGHNKN